LRKSAGSAREEKWNVRMIKKRLRLMPASSKGAASRVDVAPATRSKAIA
jgi:hypothetical protein